MAKVVDREFIAFVNERGDALLRIAYVLAGNRHAAEDLLQNALAKAYARWPRIRGDAEPYVKRVLYHDQVSAWRRRSHRAEVSLAVLPERSTERDLGHDSDLRLLLRDALLLLPPRQRAVLTLRYLEDLSVEETASILGCRAGTVASQTSRALAKLRELVPAFDELTTHQEVKR